MTAIERSAVIEILVAAQGEAFRSWLESDDPYARKAVARALEAARPLAEQLQGAVEALREIIRVSEGSVGDPAWLDHHPESPAAQVRALALDAIGGQ